MRMCTVLYHRDLGVLTKNRDKHIPAPEEIVQTRDFIAVRTTGADYFSLGINTCGCAFVSTAVNSPAWTTAAAQGNLEKARELFAEENHGLESPTRMLSALLASTTDIRLWLNRLTTDHPPWMGYNVIVADRNRAFVVETYGFRTHVRQLRDRDVITNHFLYLEHGARRYEDYPSSYDRLQYAATLMQNAETLDTIKEIIKPSDVSRQKEIWRTNAFTTVSSSILDLQSERVLYAAGLHDDYEAYRIQPAENCSAKQEELTVPHQEGAMTVFDCKGNTKIFEMSRYIDLSLYHAVERSHPFYIEMTQEILHQIGRYHEAHPGRLKVLELGAGTGLFTEEMARLDYLEVNALEIDSECLTILRSHVGDKAGFIMGDAVTYCREGAYDLVVSTFAHDHIHYDRACEFAGNIRKNLKPGGLYIMGGEILPYYETPEERKDALLKYHGFIVQEALRQGHYTLSQIEINALKSGVEMIGDFKRHAAMFEQEMSSAGLVLRSKIKVGPPDRDDTGGVFVYVYER